MQQGYIGLSQPLIFHYVKRVMSESENKLLYERAYISIES